MRVKPRSWLARKSFSKQVLQCWHRLTSYHRPSSLYCSKAHGNRYYTKKTPRLGRFFVLLVNFNWSTQSHRAPPCYGYLINGLELPQRVSSKRIPFSSSRFRANLRSASGGTSRTISPESLSLIVTRKRLSSSSLRICALVCLRLRASFSTSTASSIDSVTDASVLRLLTFSLCGLGRNVSHGDIW